MDYETLEELVIDIHRSTQAQFGAVIHFMISECVDRDPKEVLSKIWNTCLIFIEMCPESALEAHKILVEEKNASITE